MLPTALPALHREIARDFFVCPGQDSVLLWWIMIDRLTTGVRCDPREDKWVATEEETDAVVSKQQSALEIRCSP